jgi:hypothetical protein
MLADCALAERLNLEIRDICRRLDETAAVVRSAAPEDHDAYCTAIAEVYLCICDELLDPLYKAHPQIAPASWHNEQRRLK